MVINIHIRLISIVLKQSLKWSGTDGILVIKPGNYKLHGKKYRVLYMRDLSWGGRTDKKITMQVAFMHNFSGVHTKSVSTKGMLK